MPDIQIKKISTAEIGLDSKTLRKETDNAPEGTEIHVVRIIGQVSGKETGDDGKGPWIKLKGVFKAVNMLDKKIYKAVNAFLPGDAGELVLAQLSTCQEDDKFNALQIAFDFFVKSYNFGVGYTFTYQNIIPEEKIIDPLAALEKELPALPKAIEPQQTKKNGKK